jgi:hypothetical protein
VELEGKYYGYKWDEDRKMLACLHAEGKTLEEVKELLA